MDAEAVAAALGVARSAERLEHWRSRDWPRLAVELLLSGADDLEVAELAGLPASVTGWDTHEVLAILYGRYEVPEPDDAQAVAMLARLMATDLSLRPATVTAPMIRLVGGLRWLAPESDLANQCYNAAEFLDCDCVPVDPRLRTELDNFTPFTLPSNVIQILARSLRSTLPSVQPPYGH